MTNQILARRSPPFLTARACIVRDGALNWTFLMRTPVPCSHIARDDRVSNAYLFEAARCVWLDWIGAVLARPIAVNICSTSPNYDNASSVSPTARPNFIGIDTPAGPLSACTDPRCAAETLNQRFAQFVPCSAFRFSLRSTASRHLEPSRQQTSQGETTSSTS